jgi:two-component system, OmpR family, response regulator
LLETTEQRADPRFLVVEDEPELARRLARSARRVGHAVVVGTSRGANAALRENVVWSGFIIDIGLPDGSGLDVLARARLQYPMTPALVTTCHLETAFVNRAYELRAGYLVKPVEPLQIERFVRECTSAGSLSPQSLAAQVEQAVQAWTVRYGLSKAEADVLRRAALGSNRDAIAKGRQSTKQTIDKHVTNLLRRTTDRSLHAAVERLLREIAEGMHVSTRR